MQITVFGASGKVGRQVVEMALARGYTVVAFVHKTNPFESHDRLKISQGSLRDQTSVNKAVKDSEAVISALGSWGTKDKNTLTRGMRAIIPAMENSNIKRLITLTGSGAAWSQDNANLFDKTSHKLLGIVAPKILRDGEEHLRLLEASTLNWTCIRSPVMSNKRTNTYKLDYTPPSLISRVPRSAVTKCMLDQVKNSSYLRKAPHIHKV